MRRPGFWSAVAAAALLWATSIVLPLVLYPLLGPAAAIKVMVSALGLGYLIFLLRKSRVRVGRVTACLLWFAASAASWWLAPSFGLYLVTHVCLLWLLRSLYFHRSLLAALADGALCVAATAGAHATLMNTGSPSMAVWVFFLLQALFVAIPDRRRSAAACGKRQPDDAFDDARRRAEAALQQLMAR